MIIEKIYRNRKVVAFIGNEISTGIYYAFGTPSQPGGYIAFSCKDIETARAKINEHLIS
jgi:hypothetical protein